MEALFQNLPNFWSVLYNRLCLVSSIVSRFIMNLALVVYYQSLVLKSLSAIKIKIYIAIRHVYVPYIYKITLPTSNCRKSFHHYCQPQLILTHSTSLSTENKMIFRLKMYTGHGEIDLPFYFLTEFHGPLI